MPVDYYCQACGLVFSVGVYGMRSRYPCRTLLVCRSCGTCHQVQEPMNQQRPIRFLTQPGPLHRPTKPHLPTFLSRKRKWLEAAAAMPDLQRAVSRDDYGYLTCSSCGSVGTLISGWDEKDVKCPHCKEDKLAMTGNWVT